MSVLRSVIRCLSQPALEVRSYWQQAVEASLEEGATSSCPTRLTAVFMSIDPVDSSRSERTIPPRLRA
jgi:hypothetical protein